jgi:hypothetical protein
MINLGAVAIGVIAGLGIGAIGAIPILALGFDLEAAGTQSVLILLGLVGQFVAGYVAARVSVLEPELHGGLAGLGLFALIAAIALATSEQPSVITLIVGGVTALVLATLGGLLAHSRDA